MEDTDEVVEAYAEKYFADYKDRCVPLNKLMAYLSVHHRHDEQVEGGVPFVLSMVLERWAIGVAEAAR